MDPFIGEIRMFTGNFPPNGWALCNGQLMSISQNTALFSILGTNYGGDGKSTFALPNLQERAPMHHGQGEGLSDRTLGESGGTSSVSLILNELPSHKHELNSSNEIGNKESPVNGLWADTPGRRPPLAYTHYDGEPPQNSLKSMSAEAIKTTGGNQPHNNMQPYLVVNFIIALQGVYPQRS